ncbi:hypothetical protein LCGC14_0566770 [marine sediment metagenome]|uniref:Uncharacterized protein n=1 Tax=marine sediment metagenome TaxID=412755 RepID=A0A0F9RK73_9ZZZZ
MKCCYCNKGKGKNYARSASGTIYYYYCQHCVGDPKNNIGYHGADS